MAEPSGCADILDNVYERKEWKMTSHSQWIPKMVPCIIITISESDSEEHYIVLVSVILVIPVLMF